MTRRLQEVTNNSLFDYLVKVNVDDVHPFPMTLNDLRTLPFAKYYLTTQKATAAEHQLPDTLYVVYPDDGKLHWLIFVVQDHSVRFVECNGDVVLKGIEFGIGWPTEVKHLGHGYEDGGNVVIEHLSGYYFHDLDTLNADLHYLRRTVKHFTNPRVL